MGNENGMVGRLVMATGGAALVVSVFLAWYTLSLADLLRAVASQLPAALAGALPSTVAAGAPTLSWSGWHAVHLIRFVVLVVGFAALISAWAPPRAAGDRGGLLLPAGGLLATILVGYRIQSPPSTLDLYVGPVAVHAPGGAGGFLASLLQVDLGAWVAAGGGVLVVVGGLLALADSRAVIAQSARDRSVGPASVTPPANWS
ncbi:MAG TPA: hypothetical protein VHW26_09760 [Solirubrobacteraceae bacterium]|jgi:hypothetical protein|nr:hypothetical protein [Solirubrobacteraceae bacterium]